MNKYNEQYYIAEMPFGEEQLFIKPDRKTAERGYHYKRVPIGEAPFFFLNSNRECDIENGCKWPVTDILIDGSDLLVGGKIREELMKYDIDGMQLYPSVYMDDDNNWHENFWFLNFFKKYHYWDKNESVVRIDEDEEVDEDEDVSVRRYSLDEQKLDEIPEESRLMFKMGGATVAYIFVHQKIVDFIVNNNYKGVRFFKVSEFKEGIQYRKSGIDKAVEAKG